MFVLGSLRGRHLLVLTNLRLALWGDRGGSGGGVIGQSNGNRLQVMTMEIFLGDVESGVDSGGLTFSR